MYVKVTSELIFLFLYLRIKSLLPPCLDYYYQTGPLIFNNYHCLPPTLYLAPEHEGYLPTHINVTVLIKKEPGHLLAVKPDAVLNILHWGFLLPDRSIS